jgi:hypothetical protein
VTLRQTRQVRNWRDWELTGPRLSSVGRADLQATDASIGWKSTVGNLTQQDTWRSSERQTRCAASVASATDASGDPDQCITALFEGVRLYICVDRL